MIKKCRTCVENVFNNAQTDSECNYLISKIAKFRQITLKTRQKKECNGIKEDTSGVWEWLRFKEAQRNYCGNPPICRRAEHSGGDLLNYRNKINNFYFFLNIEISSNSAS